MKALRPGTLAVAIAILVAPGNAGATTVVPPENSAATQYTEAFPTAGGPSDTKHGHGGEDQRSPSEVLGKSRTRRLDAHGAQGRALAELVAETAPAPIKRPTADSSGRSGRSSRRSEGSNGQGQGSKPADENGSSARTGQENVSSGFGEAVAQATGMSSSGQMGLLLPLLIVAALVWAAIYWSRQRRRPST